MSDAVSAIPIIGPMVGGVLDVFGAGPAHEAQRRQEDLMEQQAELQRQNYEAMQDKQANLWKENAFPTQAEVQSKRASGLANIGAERSKRYEQLARNLSTRGIGPGSPYASGPASAIEGSYLTSLAGLENSLTNMQNTPRFAFPFPGAATGSSYPGYGGGGSSSNPLGAAMGMYAATQAANKYLPSIFGSTPDYPYVLDELAYEVPGASMLALL